MLLKRDRLSVVEVCSNISFSCFFFEMTINWRALLFRRKYCWKSWTFFPQLWIQLFFFLHEISSCFRVYLISFSLPTRLFPSISSHPSFFRLIDLRYFIIQRKILFVYYVIIMGYVICRNTTRNSVFKRCFRFSVIHLSFMSNLWHRACNSSIFLSTPLKIWIIAVICSMSSRFSDLTTILRCEFFYIV